MRNFLKGFFSIFNIWGNGIDTSDIELDTYKALENDWKKIGQDMQFAIDTVINGYKK